jgi:hypothetical protein
MGCTLLSLGGVRDEGNEAREMVMAHIMKGLWKLPRSVLEGESTLESDKHGALKQ